MKPLSRLFALLLMVSALACWAEPVAAARLASVSGEAGETEKRDEAEFKLSDHSEVEIQFNITQTDKACDVIVRVHRKDGGGWLVVNNTLRTTKSTNGKRSLTLPAGDYKIEVIARHAKFDVSVDK
jgi:hypothetical protein